MFLGTFGLQHLAMARPREVILLENYLRETHCIN